MLVKVDDGFYLNSHHIIAVRIYKEVQQAFVVSVEYTPNSVQKTGMFEKRFTTGREAEQYLQMLNQMIGKS
ncbi:hypothetical protein B9T33_05400 [Acinetobacter sp. ANC 5054]|uniref:hypothetical protein n=1 Tax=Acinetobacter sp. ANC 5054 TaxID=1977877 RepID=UPI000A32F992|nr:hypothetical protein [Acinetobacter sp. ANC 5054]OTG81961.1 hypothetical protein B9T33_05400 [Acinetobacter sp. ANC 5054]